MVKGIVKISVSNEVLILLIKRGVKLNLVFVKLEVLVVC